MGCVQLFVRDSIGKMFRSYRAIDNQFQGIDPLRSQRHSDTDLVGALSCGTGDHTLDADSGQHQSYRREFARSLSCRYGGPSKILPAIGKKVSRWPMWSVDACDLLSVLKPHGFTA